jgi:hypothetical protein
MTPTVIKKTGADCTRPNSVISRRIGRAGAAVCAGTSVCGSASACASASAWVGAWAWAAPRRGRRLGLPDASYVAPRAQMGPASQPLPTTAREASARSRA